MANVKKTYFISDIHLGASYIADPRGHEKRIADWLGKIADDADSLYILGDALDYWYEYRYTVPKGYVRFFGALASLSDSGVKVHWIKGNHDIWIFGYLQSELGIEVHDHHISAEIGGKRFYIAHGDIDGEPRPSYRRLQRLFRCRTAQRIFSAIHPRWTVPFAHRWSGHSRKHGRKAEDLLPADDPLLAFASGYNLKHTPADYFVFGHRHILAEASVAPDSKLFIIGDAFSLFSYAEFDGSSFTVREMSTDKILLS